MKKIIASGMLVVSLATAGCSPTWWQDLKNNPAQYIDSFVTQVTSYLTAAEAIFNAIVILIPAEQRVTIQQAFAKAVATTEHSIQVLKDAEQAAADAQQSPPDVTALIVAVVDAVTQVQDIIAEFKNSSERVGEARDVVGYDELKSAHDSIVTHYKK